MALDGLKSLKSHFNSIPSNVQHENCMCEIIRIHCFVSLYFVELVSASWRAILEEILISCRIFVCLLEICTNRCQQLVRANFIRDVS